MLGRRRGRLGSGACGLTGRAQDSWHWCPSVPIYRRLDPDHPSPPMAAPPLLALSDGRITFGGRPTFSGVSVALARGERACLVGRNGGGKSTLLRALAGLAEIDAGERFQQPGTRAAYQPQEAVFDPS